MTGRARLVFGLVVLAGLGVLAMQAPDAPAVAETAVIPTACSSCDARHARLATRGDKMTGGME